MSHPRKKPVFRADGTVPAPPPVAAPAPIPEGDLLEIRYIGEHDAWPEGLTRILPRAVALDLLKSAVWCLASDPGAQSRLHAQRHAEALADQNRTTGCCFR